MFKRVYLEITNSCNLSCAFCEATKKHDFMDINDIKSRLDEIKEVTNYVYLHILGEPLLHPFFNEILDYTDELALNVQLVTNGTLLYKYPNLLDHKSLRKCSISIHSIDNVNVSEEYFKTIDNLIDIIQTKDKQFLELRFYDEEHLSNNYLKYYNHLKKRFTFENTTKKQSYRIAPNTYIYKQVLFHWPNINDPFISDNGKCHGAIDMLGILCNGDVVICCLDAAGHTKVGNIKENSLKEILNSDKYLNVYHNMLEHKLVCKLCQKCTYRLRFDKEYK